jgi:hypothetical protein
VGVRSYKGYWVDRHQPPSPAPSLASQARLAKRPMTAAYSTGAAGASGGGYSQTIVPYNQSLINEVIHKQNDLMTRINQNETTINKLREYLEAHKRDNWDAAVTDEDLVNEGYDTIGEAVEGLGDLRKSVAAGKDMLSTATEWFNQVTAKTASDQNRISESNITEPNNQRLIEE